MSLLELADRIEALTGRKLQMSFAAARPGDQAVYITNFSKLQRDTGWQPTVGLNETLKRMQAWWKQNRELFAVPRAAEEPVLERLAIPRTA